MVQGRTSVVADHSLAFGGGLVRNDVRAVLADQGADCNLNGLYAIGGAQHVDNHTVIDHAKPHCTSHELYKGVLDGRSTGVFSGKIIVRKDAQKTDAIQSNKNLLLSDQATINTKPQLEIEADDVRCTHGATVGQIDDEALFYLQSRAIGIKEARALLTYAFAAEILDRVRFAPVRERLEAELFEWLGREQKAEQSS
jgi:Fe-S cluster assembly protein SufD